jgi:hypothetical protein
MWFSGAYWPHCHGRNGRRFAGIRSERAGRWRKSIFYPMRELLYLLRDLCQLKRGPQDWPYSPTLLGVLIAINLLLVLTIGQFKHEELLFPRAAFTAALTMGALYGLLAARDLRSRFVQTASAIVACSIVFDVLFLPVIFLLVPVPADAKQLTPQQVMLVWLGLGLGIWKVSIDAHIVRHALAIPFAAGFVVVVLWAIGSVILTASIFGGSG